jgi:hypothetical protein
MGQDDGRYYLSRVIKLAGLTQERLADAILSSPIIRIGKFDWTITDALDSRKSTPSFIFGKLAKYSSEGHVTIVDIREKSQRDAIAPNLLAASSPFVYLPDFSGIAFLHVWNEIQEDVFPKRFRSLIEGAYESFFVGCELDPIADYREFIQKLEGLERITKIRARVHPPNPLFGHRWKKLKEYLKERGASELTVDEKQKSGDGLNTKLPRLIKDLLEPGQKDTKDVPPVDITDAAVLMAADGYGKGKVVGQQRGELVVVRTSEAHKSFGFPKEPEPVALATTAAGLFEEISNERRMGH